MIFLDILAVVTLVGAVLYVLTSAFRDGQLRIHWAVPAALFVAFAAYSVVTVLEEGPLGFWANHTESLWGLQVWMDLLFAVAIAWTFLLPEAKRQGLSILPWGLFVVCTASIGLLAMMARVLWLRDRAAQAATA